MPQIQESVETLLDGLYSDRLIAVISGLSQRYIDSYAATAEVPSSLHDITSARMMSKHHVDLPRRLAEDIDPMLWKLGISEGNQFYGPLNHVLARLFTIPMMLQGYIDNYPIDQAEKSIYTDPPLLQRPVDEIKEDFDNWFGQAADELGKELELVERFKLLGEVGEEIAQVEKVYGAKGSTQAYELFGIFHLFPSNRQVDLTSTSPGVILPTEADPLRFKDTVDILKKNLLRPTYFRMLRHSVDIDDERIRRYSANRNGTAENLKAYPDLSEAAKEILERYLAIREKFEIRLGDQEPVMKRATLVGDIGVVYSVRDKDQKSKIAHNVTVMNPDEAKNYRKIFDDQWVNGEPVTDTAIVDRLIKA